MESAEQNKQTDQTDSGYSHDEIKVAEQLNTKPELVRILAKLANIDCNKPADKASLKKFVEFRNTEKTLS